jgi:hypothetical protein
VVETMRRYELKSAEAGAKHCLHGDDNSIQVTRMDGDPAKDDVVKIWVQCEPSRRPVPSTQQKIDGKWMVTSFSW